MFDIPELKKGYFPHHFNTNANKSYVGPYPDVKYYGVDTMTVTEVPSFMAWHSQQNGKVFDLQKELLEYCRSDTELLRVACIKFRKLMIETTALDPFTCITLASLCGKVYRTKFLEESWRVKLTNTDGNNTDWLEAKVKFGKWKVLLDDTWVDPSTEGYTITSKKFVKSPLAIVPTEGYIKRDQYSQISIQWLEWVSLQ
jgi:hypothetical protein